MTLSRTRSGSASRVGRGIDYSARPSDFCQADGTWSGDPAACNRESFLFVHKALLWQGCQKIKNKVQVWLKLVCLCFKRLGYT